MSIVSFKDSQGGAGCGWIMRSSDRDHPGQHGETPTLLKIQKINEANVMMCVCSPRYSGG